MYDFDQFDDYELLGVARSASAADIKRAYRREIAQYHPDKWSKADAAAQEYARKRAAAITEAYSKLKSFNQRTAAPIDDAPMAASRAERLDQLYEQSRSLLAQGQFDQAATLLRQIQQADPFYRDSADLLARAEAQARTPAPAAAPVRRNNRGLLLGALATLGLVAVIGAVWLLGGSATNITADVPTATLVAGGIDEPTAIQVGQSPTPADVIAPTLPPAATREPTAAPTVAAAATPAPTAAPSDTPAAPTATAPPAATATPDLPDDLSGTVLLADALDGGGWPTVNSGQWNFGFENGRYRMTMQPGVGTVWAYSGVLPSDSVVLAVDVEVTAGSAGLMWGFQSSSDYYRFLLGVDGTWALQQRTAAGLDLLLSGEGLGPGRLVVAQRGPVTHVYWNTTYLGEAVLPAFPAGNYGFILAGSGTADAYFNDLRIRQLP